VNRCQATWIAPHARGTLGTSVAGVDFICGSDTDRQDDGALGLLIGGEGADLACPLDDETTVNSVEQ
jgi:hypothetical protein